MAISDIPEYVEVAPGDLIRAENWNSMQQQMRNSLRQHHHTRAPSAPVTDTAATDEATQIGTNEIADGAVTSPKLAAGAITAANIPDGAITSTKLADGAVVAAKIADGAVVTNKIGANAVTSSRIAFSTIQQGSTDVPGGGTMEPPIQTGSGKGGGGTATAILFFPLVTVTRSTGTGVAEVQADIIYRLAVGGTVPDVFLRLRNTGSATATVIWKVVTFAS
jgi:hypothetical protein